MDSLISRFVKCYDKTRFCDVSLPFGYDRLSFVTKWKNKICLCNIPKRSLTASTSWEEAQELELSGETPDQEMVMRNHI